jgi:hypothetical protein
VRRASRAWCGKCYTRTGRSDSGSGAATPAGPGQSPVPFKANQNRRHRIPKQRSGFEPPVPPFKKNITNSGSTRIEEWGRCCDGALSDTGPALPRQLLDARLGAAEREGHKLSFPRDGRRFQACPLRLLRYPRTARETDPIARGTGGSHPPSSSGESGANLSLAGIRLPTSRSCGSPRVCGPWRAARSAETRRTRQYRAYGR